MTFLERMHRGPAGAKLSERPCAFVQHMTLLRRGRWLPPHPGLPVLSCSVLLFFPKCTSYTDLLATSSLARD